MIKKYKNRERSCNCAPHNQNSFIGAVASALSFAESPNLTGGQSIQRAPRMQTMKQRKIVKNSQNLMSELDVKAR